MAKADEKKKGKGQGKGKSRSRSKSDTGTTPGGIKWIEVGKTGEKKKKPMCCMAFRKNGKCEYEATTGKKCGFDHWNDAEYAEVERKLNRELGQ